MLSRASGRDASPSSTVTTVRMRNLLAVQNIGRMYSYSASWWCAAEPMAVATADFMIVGDTYDGGRT